MIQGRVSAVVASYNHAAFLPRRMDSLMTQTYSNLEILVVDDCSTDDSVDVLRRYESQLNVTVVARERNGGWISTSNEGLNRSSGEFVIFANCDDDCDPRMIERLVQEMARHPTAGIAFCRSLFIDEEDRVIGDDFATRERAFRVRCSSDTLLTGAEMERFLLHSCVIPNLSAALIRRECLSTLGAFTAAYRVCNDWDLFFRIAAKYDVAYVAEALNRFRQHPTTIRITTKSGITIAEYLRLLLGRIRTLDLSWTERVRYRTRVMYLWSGHVMAPSWVGIANIPWHLGIVLRHDPAALLLLAPSALQRVVDVMRKALCGRTRAGEVVRERGEPATSM